MTKNELNRTPKDQEMPEFEELVGFALKELPKKEQEAVWEKIKNDGDTLTLVEDIEHTIEEQGFKDVQAVLNWYHKRQGEFEQFMHKISYKEIAEATKNESETPQGVLNKLDNEQQHSPMDKKGSTNSKQMNHVREK